MKESGRLSNIDITKGIAIITVSICHILDVVSTERTFMQQWGYSWELFAFFFLGGVVSEYKFRNEELQKISFKLYIVKDIKSILWPYLTFSMFYIFLNRGSGIKDMITISGIGALWFLPVYFIGNVITYGILRLFNKNQGVLLTVVGCLLGLSCICSFIIQNYYLQQVWDSDGRLILAKISRIVICSSVVTLGMLLHRIQLRDFNKYILAGIILLLVGVIASVCNDRVNLRYGYFSNPIWFYIGGICTTCGFLFLFKKHSIRWIEKIGYNSIIIFGLQNLFVSVASKINSKVEGFWLVFSLVVIICITISVISIFLIRKTFFIYIIKIGGKNNGKLEERRRG